MVRAGIPIAHVRLVDYWGGSERREKAGKQVKHVPTYLLASESTLHTVNYGECCGDRASAAASSHADIFNLTQRTQ